MSTENIQRFLQTYGDQALIALLDHAEKGMLAFSSCCCLIGARNAPHALKGYLHFGTAQPADCYHHQEMRDIPGGKEAEDEYRALGSDDVERRERIIPLIRAEILRRETERGQSSTPALGANEAVGVA